MRISILLFSFILFNACKKKDRVSSTRVNLMIVNASPNSGTVELLQNLNSVGQFNYLNGFTPAVNYNIVDSGFNNYKLKKGNDEIASWVFAGQKFHHTLFICDSLIPSKVKYFFMQDNLDTVGLGKKSKIRLVQLSPDIDTIQLVVQQKVNPTRDSPVVQELLYYGKFEQSVLINAGSFQEFFGDTTMNIKVRRKADSTVIKNYRFNFQKGKVYSLVLKGYAARSGKDSLSFSIISHN
jgi:F0F1-type ATP synthase gamma subunit